MWMGDHNTKQVYYDRSLQMQCVEAAGKILFIGINFLARSPKVPKQELDQARTTSLFFCVFFYVSSFLCLTRALAPAMYAQHAALMTSLFLLRTGARARARAHTHTHTHT